MVSWCQNNHNCSKKKKLKRKEWKITVTYRELLFLIFDFSVDYLEDVLCHEFASLALSSMAGKLMNYRMTL